MVCVKSNKKKEHWACQIGWQEEVTKLILTCITERCTYELITQLLSVCSPQTLHSASTQVSISDWDLATRKYTRSLVSTLNTCLYLHDEEYSIYVSKYAANTELNINGTL